MSEWGGALRGRAVPAPVHFLIICFRPHNASGIGRDARHYNPIARLKMLYRFRMIFQMAVLAKHRFSTSEYYRMAETGVIRADARVEFLYLNLEIGHLLRD